MNGLKPNESCTYTCGFEELSLTVEEVSLYLGYGVNEPDPRIRAIIEDMIEQMATLCRPRFGYGRFEGHSGTRDSLTVSKLVFHPGPIITRYLKESEFYLLFVATAGHEYDLWRRDQDSDIVRQFVADSLGSAIAEATVAKALEQMSLMTARSGMKITNSYSPGYCGWDVREQQILFSLLPPGFCEITLSESGLMIPVKSVSGIVGMGKHVEKKPYGCAICRKKDCFKRRIRLETQTIT